MATHDTSASKDLVSRSVQSSRASSVKARHDAKFPRPPLLLLNIVLAPAGLALVALPLLLQQAGRQEGQERGAPFQKLRAAGQGQQELDLEQQPISIQFRPVRHAHKSTPWAWQVTPGSRLPKPPKPNGTHPPFATHPPTHPPFGSTRTACPSSAAPAPPASAAAASQPAPQLAVHRKLHRGAANAAAGGGNGGVG
jgi:hypothetical protein